MLEKGAIRIGTLHEFRGEEDHGNEIGDAEEGIVSAYSNDPMVDLQRPETVSPIVRQVLGLSPDGPAPAYEFHDIEFESRTDSPNCWIYCTSRDFDERAMKRMKRDTCIIINSPEQFYRAVLAELRSRDLIRSGSLGPCIYLDRKQHYTRLPPVHPALIKDPKYEYQNEARAIWLPRSLPIKHLDLVCLAAVESCSLFSP
jgi:hypothetical protein